MAGEVLRGEPDEPLVAADMRWQVRGIEMHEARQSLFGEIPGRNVSARACRCNHGLLRSLGEIRFPTRSGCEILAMNPASRGAVPPRENSPW